MSIKHFLSFTIFFQFSFFPVFAKDAFNPLTGQPLSGYENFSQQEVGVTNTYKVLGTIKVFEKNLPWFLERKFDKKQPVSSYSEKLFLRIQNTKGLDWLKMSKDEMLQKLSQLKVKLSAFLPNVVFVREHQNNTSEIVFGPFFSRNQAKAIQSLISRYNLDFRNENMILTTDLVFRSYEFNIKPALAIFKNRPNGILAFKEGEIIGSTPWLIVKVLENAVVAYNSKQLKTFHQLDLIK